MTFQPVEPRQPDFRPTNNRRGCLIGCSVVLFLLVALAVFGGLLAKKAFDDVAGRNDKVTTTTASPDARQVTAAEYGDLVATHGATLSTEAQAVGQQCKSLTSDPGPCRTAIAAMHTELAATQADLATVKAPPELAGTDAKLRQSVVDGLSGTADVNTGLNNHPLTLAKGLIEVAKAATQLRQAESTLNSELGSTITTG